MLRNTVNSTKFNQNALFPYEMAMQDVYDSFFDVNSYLVKKGLQRLDDMLRPAIMSGVLSDMLTASLAKHSRTLTENRYFNGHPRSRCSRGCIPETQLSQARKELKSRQLARLGEQLTRMGRETNGCACSCTMSTQRQNRHATAAPWHSLRFILGK